MAKTRTLPDKYYDKDYETNGIHRVPLWRIAGFALNNTATNLYLMFMNYVLSTGLCWRWHGYGIQLYHGYAYLGRRNGPVHWLHGG